MEYTLNNFIGDTLYVLERQNFGTLEFNGEKINSRNGLFGYSDGYGRSTGSSRSSYFGCQYGHEWY